MTYPAVGRRFVPDNVGMALVESSTADVFALRLKHNNALISFQMRPNPEIPPDRNIITFPINPRYTKQGSLDGKIGFQVDPSWPNALGYSSDASYFKTLEAYALKSDIEREEAALRTEFTGFDAPSYGTSAPPSGPGAIEERLRKPLSASIGKHNIVNNYIWTADGGLFAESQETLESFQEVVGGSYSFKGMGGVFMDLTFGVFSIGFKAELDAMVGGHLNRTVTKSEETEKSFALNVDFAGVESDVYLRDAQGELIMDLSDPQGPKPQRQPGRVDAYRFMSFLLEPKSDHFETFFNKVVDPIWLEQSDEPNAAALREAAEQGKKPPCWRILHRVTYVSRVLPPFSQDAPPSLDKALQTLDIDSNYQLIRQLEPFVREKLTSQGEFNQAVEDTVRTYLPELQPHLPEIKQHLSDYFGIVAGPGAADGEAFGEASLAERGLNQAPIVNAGPEQTVGLDGVSVTVELEGTVIDDRLERAEAIFVTWEQREGTGEVRLQAPHALAAAATFGQRGRYVLQLTADDGEIAASDETVVTVNEPPLVSAGSGLEVQPGSARRLLAAMADDDPDRPWLEAQLAADPLLGTTRLAGSLVDDGLGDPERGRVALQWSKIGGAGELRFADAKALATLASFSRSGHYLLRLAADNESFASDSEITVAVAARVTRQLEALYTFQETEGTTVRDVSGVGSPLNLVVTEPAAIAWHSGGLAIVAPTLIASAGPAGRLIAAIRASGELTVEAWIKPAAQDHEGLARIVTLSSGPAVRNFTLGQADRGFHAALRTIATNANASDRALTAATAAPAALSHLVCSRDAAGSLLLYLDGRLIGQRQVDGALSNWDTGAVLALGNEVGNELGAEVDSSRAWLGTLHLVAIYSRALSAEEIEQNRLFGADSDLPPVVHAGDDRVVDVAALPALVPLAAVVTHDRPSPGASLRWSQVAGPGEVQFRPETEALSEVSLSRKGRYLLRLTADDGSAMASDELTVIVNTAPAIRAGGVAHVSLPDSLQLAGEIEDSGLAEPSQGRLSTRWSKRSGAGKTVFANPAAADTTVTFDRPGAYQLELKAHNGRLEASDRLSVFVHQLPVARVTAPAVVTLEPDDSARAVLEAEVVSDGLGDPARTVSLRWTHASGPGAVRFEPSDTDPSPTAVFAVSGRHELQLTVDNGHLAARQQVAVTVNRPPLVDAGPSQTVELTAAAVLDATVGDDGLPLEPGRVALSWSKLSGPGAVTFTDARADYTTARFALPGSYVLRLTADDGAAKSHDDVTVEVLPPPRVSQGLQVLYRFQEGSGATIGDTAGVAAPLDLVIEDPASTRWCGDSQQPGLIVTAVTLIRARDPASRLTAAIKSAGAFTVEAWVTPDSRNAAGEQTTRIVTLSQDHQNRNFTLGQTGALFVGRLRTRAKGKADLNGVAEQVEAGRAAAGATVHLAFVVEQVERRASLFLDGVLEKSVALKGDISASWSDDFDFALANELNRERAWLGQYHLVAVYDRALSNEEVTQNHLAGPA